MADTSYGPAFPVSIPTPEGGVAHYPGMSQRDCFAAAALIGLLAHASGEDPDIAPARAFKLADAMLKAREVQP